MKQIWFPTKSRPVIWRGISAGAELAADENLDLLVMGGYGHSRLQERFLGGVTRAMLEAMTVPTLMSH